MNDYNLVFVISILNEYFMVWCCSVFDGTHIPRANGFNGFPSMIYTSVGDLVPGSFTSPRYLKHGR